MSGLGTLQLTVNLPPELSLAAAAALGQEVETYYQLDDRARSIVTSGNFKKWAELNRNRSVGDWSAVRFEHGKESAEVNLLTDTKVTFNVDFSCLKEEDLLRVRIPGFFAPTPPSIYGAPGGKLVVHNELTLPGNALAEACNEYVQSEEAQFWTGTRGWTEVTRAEVDVLYQADDTVAGLPGSLKGFKIGQVRVTEAQTLTTAQVACRALTCRRLRPDSLVEFNEILEEFEEVKKST